jgi:aminopeptidase N
MKKFVFLFFLIFSVIKSIGQYNVPVYLNDDYCNHIKACENYVRSYYEPSRSNLLLGNYDVSFYFLDLNVENYTTALSGNVTIKAKALITLDTFAFELYSGMTIDSVLLDGKPYGFQNINDYVKIPVSPVISTGTYFTARIYYHGTPPSEGFFSGITTAYNETYQKYVTWTLSEPYAAKDWWPTKQDLGDKADSVWVFLTTSPENKAGSQGLLTGVTPMPGGKVRYEWKSRYPIAYYLISFAVADYQEYNFYAHPEGTEDSVFIQNYIYDDPDFLPVYQNDINRTASFIELFSDLFGLYPFIDEKYGHCMTQLGGGMEHQTMTTLGGFSFGLVSHELGHMWFGDKVTCANWSDIWINEGFATYTDYLAHHFLSTPYYDSVWLQIRHEDVKSQPGGSVYVPPDQLGDIWRIFDGRLSYSKGALLLHMIRFELQDDELFFNILKSYVEEYGDSVATATDFREWLELKSGKDFTGFFNQWYYGEGYPVYDIAWYQQNDTLDITATQTTSTSITTLFKMLVPYHLKFTDGTDSTLLLYQDSNLDRYSIPVLKTISQIELDPDQWILHKLNTMTFGMEEPDNPLLFSIGPNPARDHFSIFLSHNTSKTLDIIISDLSGRIIYQDIFNHSDNVIFTKGIPAGVYIVSVTNGKEKLNRRLIIE